jgi:hypothetical protein
MSEMNDRPFADSRALTPADLEDGPDVEPSTDYVLAKLSPAMVSLDGVNFHEVPDGMTTAEFAASLLA